MSLSWVEAEWPAPRGVRVVSTSRLGGASAGRYASLNLGDHVGDEPAAVAENRRRLMAAAGLPSAPVWLRQVHGAAVLDLDAPRAADGPATADAAFTRRGGRVCAILTADCLPLVLTADSGAVVGAVHAGWRGLAAGVIEAAVKAMCTVGARKSAGADAAAEAEVGAEADTAEADTAEAGAAAGVEAVAAAGLMAWLGPAIGAGHFEVGTEVREALLAADPGAEGAFAANARGRFMADLSGLARRRLEALGVGRIYGGGVCTHAAGDRYFSHRRDGMTGRQATLIWREAGAGDAWNDGRESR